jgi:hypothetical protein
MAAGRQRELTFLRYFGLTHLPGPKRETRFRVLAAHVNQLSTDPVIAPPLALVPGRGAVPMATVKPEEWPTVEAARVDIRDYRWSKALYARLAKADVEYHADVEVETLEHWPGGPDPATGRDYPPGVYVVGREVKRQAAPWLPAADVKFLQDALDTVVPVLSADFFLWQTLQDVDRNPGYHDFLYFDDLASFDALVGFDRRASADFLSELREAVAESGVSKQPRRVARFDKLGGAYWQTFDNRLAVARKGKQRDPLRTLDDTFEFDASEIYAHLPNGLWAMGLFNARGVRQDSAPDFIGGDRTSTSNDSRIHNNHSCITCHADGGLKDIDGWARNLYAPGGLALSSPDYQVLKDLKRKYLRHLEPHMKRDRERYAEALKEASGLTPREFASEVGKFWAEEDSLAVDLARAAAKLGVTEEKWLAALNHRLRTRGDVDGVLGTYLLPADRRKGIPVDQFREAYPLAQQYLAEAIGAGALKKD